MPNEADLRQLPAITQQVHDLVVAGSIDEAEEAFSDAAEKFGDLAVVEIINKLEPQVASLHLTAFDGGKLSLAMLLVPPKVWAESLVFFAAPWSEEKIEDEPEVLTESLFAHIHGVLYATDDVERRTDLIHAALATDHGTTAFAILFSTAAFEIIELANDIYRNGVQRVGVTSNDHDVVPLAIDVAKTDEEAWERVLFELFPNWHPGGDDINPESDYDHDAEEDDEPRTPGRSTQELMFRLRRQVPSKRSNKVSSSGRESLGEDIFS